MKYEDYLNEVQDLSFVEDRETADALIKSTLGHFASRLPKNDAQLFCDRFPSPLHYYKLRGHQKNGELELEFKDFLQALQSEFGIEREEALESFRCIYRLVKKEIPEQERITFEKDLPEAWRQALKAA